MIENITAIKDPTLYIEPSEKLVNYLKENYEEINKNANYVPENIKCLVENENNLLKSSDIVWVNRFLINQRNEEKICLLTGKELYDEVNKMIDNKCSGFNFKGYLEEKKKKDVYLHEILEGSKLLLPQNEVVKRNPVLEERVQKLKKEQEEKEYKEMTKNVDTRRRHLPEDTVSYEMKMMNRHLIAVLQFLVSVGAGFAFGFFGLELVVGELNFGVRLLMGITFAVIIAIAEFYFLAKHLDEEEKQEEEEETVPKEKGKTKGPSDGNAEKTKCKLHAD